jgi:hypothetical protein
MPITGPKIKYLYTIADDGLISGSARDLKQNCANEGVGDNSSRSIYHQPPRLGPDFIESVCNRDPRIEDRWPQIHPRPDLTRAIRSRSSGSCPIARRGTDPSNPGRRSWIRRQPVMIPNSHPGDGGGRCPWWCHGRNLAIRRPITPTTLEGTGANLVGEMTSRRSAQRGLTTRLDQSEVGLNSGEESIVSYRTNRPRLRLARGIRSNGPDARTRPSMGFLSFSFLFVYLCPIFSF